MAYLLLILIVFALLAGFLALTQYEAARGMRFFVVERTKFDAFTTRIQFIIEHVDFAAFVKDEVRHMLTRFGHATASFSLHAVRATERLLTRAVRHLRTQHEEEVAPRETAREFVKTLSDFKETLNAAHPEPNVRAESEREEQKKVEGNGLVF